MDPVDLLIEKLQRHPQLTHHATEFGVRIDAPNSNGFVVELERGNSEWTIYLGESGFHMHIVDPAETLELVAMCYSGETRLREIKRGETTTSAYFEQLSHGKWTCIGRYGRLWSPLWRARAQTVYENPNLLSD